MQFRIQSTPNPLARKYLLSRDIKKTGKVSYQETKQCQHVPLALALLSIEGVRQVHFFENVLTMTQDGSLDWTYLDQKVQQVTLSHIDSHDIEFEDFIQEAEAPKPELSPELKVVDAILDRSIRPSLQADGGDVEPLDLEDNILTIKYMGACGGCPSAMTGTLEAIRRVLISEFREDIEVVAI